MSRFAPPKELWDAAKCARVLGFRTVGQFKYRVKCGELPAPHCFDCGKAWWDAAQVRDAAMMRRGLAQSLCVEVW